MRNQDKDSTDAQDHLDNLHVLQRVHTYGISTKSDLAREYADEFAALACLGYITTLVIYGGSIYGRVWKITPMGLLYLAHHAALIIQAEEQHFRREHVEGGTEG